MESAIAKLNKYRMSPRKVRLVADMIRGMEVVKAINLLKNDSKKVSKPMAKLLLSSVANWHQKNGADHDEDLYINKIFVDSAPMLKRIKPAPQGRAHRIRKRFSRITIEVNSSNNIKKNEDKFSKTIQKNKIIPETLKKIHTTSETKNIEANNKKINLVNKKELKDQTLDKTKEDKNNKKE